MRVRERDLMTKAKIRKREKDLKTLLYTTGLKMKEGTISPGMQAPLEAGEHKEKDFP